MPGTATQPCPFSERVAALARGELAGDARRDLHRHLEHCEVCRAQFRRHSEGRFPRLRSYTFIESIGAGGFGEVYKVIHHAKERTEALKLLHDYTQFRQAQSFENEIHLIAQLRHPHIATLYDAHLGTPPFYFTMEYVEGRPLDEHFRRPDVQLLERIEILRRVAEAMDYAHRQGVVHRDLMPRNILVDADGQPRIVDFGIARILATPAGAADEAGAGTDAGADAGPQAGRRRGRAVADGAEGYIAPEVEAGHRGDGRADVFAIGALLCRAVAGQPPPDADLREALTAALAALEVRRPAELAAIVEKCLRESPEDRYATCGELAADLDRYVAARPLQATAPHSVAHRGVRATERFLRTRPRLMIGALTVLAVLASAALLKAVNARQFGSFSQDVETTLIEFRPSTIRAIRSGAIGADLAGLSADVPKSWRLLHGQVLEALAQAGVKAVVCDYYVPDCQPEYDDELVGGFDALREAGIPAVIGSKRFDINGRPVGCPHVLGAAHICGALHGLDSAWKPDEFLVTVCIIRGPAPPIPSLSVAGFAAARFPDSLPDLRPTDDAVDVAYRRMHVAAGEREWHREVDVLPITRRERANPSLSNADEMIYGGVPAESVLEWPKRALTVEAVLAMPTKELGERLRGTVVLYGPALPGEDEHTLDGGTPIFGCWVQAQALSGLLRGHLPANPLKVWELLAGAAAWGIAAALAAAWLPLHDGRARLSVTMCAIVVSAGFAIGLRAWLVLSTWQLQVVIAACVSLMVGGAVYAYRSIRSRLARVTFADPPPYPVESQPAT